MSSHSGNRSLLALAAVGVPVGIALSVSGNSGLGGWVTVGALVLLVYGLHRLGRSGPDAPLEAYRGDDRD